jgi:hypothetical protein
MRTVRRRLTLGRSFPGGTGRLDAAAEPAGIVSPIDQEDQSLAWAAKELGRGGILCRLKGTRSSLPWQAVGSEACGPASRRSPAQSRYSRSQRRSADHRRPPCAAHEPVVPARTRTIALRQITLRRGRAHRFSGGHRRHGRRRRVHRHGRHAPLPRRARQSRCACRHGRRRCGCGGSDGNDRRR